MKKRENVSELQRRRTGATALHDSHTWCMRADGCLAAAIIPITTQAIMAPVDELWQTFIRCEKVLTNVTKQTPPEQMSSSKMADLDLVELTQEDSHEVVSITPS